MENLMQPKIKDSCKLELPEGLQNLMYDISREVLRAQPQDLYKFIADYLSALILTRETLSIAGQICGDVCDCCCQPELEQELRDIGLEGDDLVTANKVITKYFEEGVVNEAKLLTKLFKSTDIQENLLPAILDAIHIAFLRHQLNHPKRYNMPSLNPAAVTAADHTLSYYERHMDNDDLKEKSATKIQAVVRGYLVRKNKHLNEIDLDKNAQNIEEFKNEFLRAHSSKPHTSICSASSQSLAGSFLNLPRFVPYSAHLAIEEIEERELDRSKMKQRNVTRFISFNDEHTLQEIESYRRTNIDYADIDDDTRSVVSFNDNILVKVISPTGGMASKNSSIDDILSEHDTNMNIHTNFDDTLEEINQQVDLESESTDSEVIEDIHNSFEENVEDLEGEVKEVEEVIEEKSSTQRFIEEFGGGLLGVKDSQESIDNFGTE